MASALGVMNFVLLVLRADRHDYRIFHLVACDGVACTTQLRMPPTQNSLTTERFEHQ
jgi:hypothetical protein